MSRADHAWTPETLIGFVHSTSVLSRAGPGGRAPGFEDDLRRRLRAFAPAGRRSPRRPAWTS